MDSYNVRVVQAIQDYIKIHSQDAVFSIDHVCAAAGYSRRQVDRLFKKYFDKTLQEYIKAVCLTQGANQLAETEQNILEVALSSHFKSHEGFTRSFTRHFSVTPSEYREKKIPIPLFIQYPISHYHVLLEYKEDLKMSNDLKFCMITPSERPQRKLIYLPSSSAKDYFSYCEEMGCEWEGLLNSIDEKFDLAALIELPGFLLEGASSKIAAGIEVPLDYNKPLPDCYKTAVLKECIMLYFQSEPYEDEEDFCKAIESTYAAIGKYNPSIYGYKFAYDVAPSFNFGAEAAVGAKIAVPVLNV